MLLIHIFEDCSGIMADPPPPTENHPDREFFCWGGGVPHYKNELVYHYYYTEIVLSLEIPLLNSTTKNRLKYKPRSTPKSMVCRSPFLPVIT